MVFIVRFGRKSACRGPSSELLLSLDFAPLQRMPYGMTINALHTSLSLSQRAVSLLSVLLSRARRPWDAARPCASPGLGALISVCLGHCFLAVRIGWRKIRRQSTQQNCSLCGSRLQCLEHRS